jgi:probable F420-dependent oxidoreductase
VRIGYSTMNNPIGPSPTVLGVELEARGYESLWIGEHPQIPVSRATPYPGGSEMPEMYRSMMNPFLSLQAAASATTDLLVGTGVALPLEHELFDLAKTISTLDVLSGGRFLFGVGVGWNVEELANVSTVPWAKRYRALAECVGALRALWCEEEASFDGEFFSFEPVWSLPKPLQDPHPPVFLGAAGRIGTREALAWADGWMPMDLALGDVPKKVLRFRQAAEDAGRDPAEIPITLVLFGDPRLETIEAYRHLDVDRVVIGASRRNEDDPSSAMRFLDHYQELNDLLR